MYDRTSSRQLYSPAPREFVFPNFVDHDGKLHTRPADNLPLMIWPDGSWCAPANTFMRELLEKGLSRRNRGGSLAVAAAHLSHLLRYCWERRLDFIDLTDNDFREFINKLQLETRRRDPTQKRRNATSVVMIGRNCLAFLDSLGRQAGDPTFVAPDGRIRACIREHVVKISGAPRKGATKTVRYWHHTALPNPDPQQKRLPISTANINDLRKAVGVISTTAHQRARRHTMLKLLEVTGARRGEVALITVESLIQAEAMEHPMLRVPTLKKRGGRAQYRYVPISSADLGFIRQYAEVHRRSVLRRKLKGRADHGFLLVSGVTGEALQPNTVTQEVRLLAKAAGIRETACPHMFRHRFLTKLFVALIEQHTIENADHFRRLLIDGETLKQKVAEWTGHSSLESLNRYISLAFDEIGGYRKVYDLTMAGLALDSFLGTIEAELEAAAAGEQPVLILGRLQARLTQLKEDLACAKVAANERTLQPGTETASAA